MMQRLAGDGGGAEGGENEDDEEDEDDEDYDENAPGAEEEEWKGLADKTLCDEKDRITPESFAAWKVKFDAELVAMGILKRDENRGKSGKQIFCETKDEQAAGAGTEG